MSAITGGGSDLFTLVSNVPPSSSSPGTPYDIVWDNLGNMYIAYQPGVWAKYLNSFTPSPPSTDAQPLGMP